jgi:ATP-dependent protease ClpP protease subunit
MRNVLEIKNQTETNADLYIYGDIVNSEWDRWMPEDTSPELVRNFLDQIKGKDLKVYLNSGGGSVFGGLAVSSMLSRHAKEGNKVDIHVDGLAGSIASVIALSGTSLTIPSNAFMMIHSPWVSISGNASDLRKMANDLDRIQTGIENVYQANLKDGVDMATIRAMITKETWLNGEEAAKYFNINTSDALPAVACVSNYFKNYADMPAEISQFLEEEKEEQAEEIQNEEVNEENIEDSAEDLQIETESETEKDEVLMLIDLI